jgi:AcrR family transcriptional regulator
MTDDSFRRARRPEQKAQRREAILEAASALLVEQGLDATTLSAIAARAGMVKSAVYRYFHSREAVLMDLLVTDIADAVDEITARLPPGSGDPAMAAAAMAEAYAARPRLCLLTSAMASVLETNLTPEEIARYKGGILAQVGRAVVCLHAAIPALPEGAGARAAMHLHLMVAGLWPFSNPPAHVAEVMARPEFSIFRKDFQITLQAEVETHLRGLIAGGA